VAFRAWRPFNFNEAGIGDERLWHVLPALDQAGAQNSQSPVAAKKGAVMPDQCLKVHPVPRTKG